MFNLAKKNKFKVLTLLLTLSLITGILAGCSSSKSFVSESYNTDDAFMDFESTVQSNGSGFGFLGDKSESVSEPQAAVRPSVEDNDTFNKDNTSSESILSTINMEKLVYKANYNLETKDYDASLTGLKAWISECGGIVGSEAYGDNSYYGYEKAYYYNSGRSYNCVVRIPTANFEKFTSAVANFGHIKSSNSYVENISQQYYDTKATLESYENQMEKLQEMYQYADSIEEMMNLEARIADVQAEILKLKTHIQSMDMDVAFSTIDIRINEVVDYSEPITPEGQRTFFGRLKITLIDSWDNFLDNAENFLFWLIYNIWGLIILVIIILIVIKIFRKGKNKRLANKKTKKIDKKDISKPNKDGDESSNGQ